jgi:HEAT repeat protein
MQTSRTASAATLVLAAVIALLIAPRPVQAQEPEPTEPLVEEPLTRPSTEEAVPPAKEPLTKTPTEETEPGTKLETLFADFLHFVKMGRFDMANSFAAALLEHPNLDPLTMVELSEKYHDSVETLIEATRLADVGPNALRVLEVIRQGEFMVKTDPERIVAQIERLYGSPQAVLNATARLRESGEYAVPFLIQAIRDPANKSHLPRLVQALSQIGLPAVRPLTAALPVRDDAVKIILVQVLGEIGYPQALPYLQQIIESEQTSSEVREVAEQAFLAIERTAQITAPRDASQLFYQLATDYYYEVGSLRVDPRTERMANVWHYRDGLLVNVPVPAEILDEVMCMRCAEQALRLAPDFAAAEALWLAANFRREAQLGVAEVDAEAPDPVLQLDKTRPADFPRAIYFARAAGPKYNQMVLARSLHDRDPGVMLGAIAALQATAGPSSLVGSADLQQPLVECLTFPDPFVRIRAALVLAAALPSEPFFGSDNVVPALAEALALTGQRTAVVVDPDQTSRNATTIVLREAGFVVVEEPSLAPALQRAKKELATLDLICLGTDVKDPDLAGAMARLESDYLYAATPVILLVKPMQSALAEDFAEAYPRVGRALTTMIQVRGKEEAEQPTEELAGYRDHLLLEWRRVAKRIGRREITADVALQLALESAQVLREIADTRSPVYQFSRAEPALIEALKHPAEELRLRVAGVLALTPSPEAQQALAAVALDDQQSKTLRMKAFASLAESARTHGNELTDEQVSAVIKIAAAAEDLEMRTAASQALGALNLATNEASEIIRGYASE